jgi:hypothetical protein
MKEAILDGAELRLYTRLGRWHTAAELGCDEALLARWEASDLLFWSSAKPTRALGGAPLEDDGGPIALARNAYVGPLVARGGELAWFDFMPRRGELSGAELVGADLTAWEWHEAVLRARVVCCARHGAVLPPRSSRPPVAACSSIRSSSRRASRGAPATTRRPTGATSALSTPSSSPTPTTTTSSLM